jgi:hypothetical protein
MSARVGSVVAVVALRAALRGDRGSTMGRQGMKLGDLRLRIDVLRDGKTWGVVAHVWWRGGQAEVASQGRTRASALKNIIEAIAFYIEERTG